MKLSVIHTADRRKVLATTIDGYKVQRATGVAIMTVLKKWKMVKVVYILQRGVPRTKSCRLRYVCAVRGYNVP